MDIALLPQPTLDEFAAAADVCEVRWPYLRAMHTPARFAAFQRLGVQLVAARDGDRMVGVCFVLPCRYVFGGEVVEWVNLFQLATRPEARSIGGLILMRIMSLYPTAVSLGVTDEAARMYVALRWKRHDAVWRGVHPIDMGRVAEDYGERMSAPVRRAVSLAAGGYNALAVAGEALLSLGVPARTWNPASAADAALREKGIAVATYASILHCGNGTRVVETGGIGRVLDSYREGWGTVRAHARAWRELRRRGAKLCEVLASTPEAKARLLRLGYAALPMPMWYTEKNGMASKLIAALNRNDVSFFHTDKSV